MNEVKASHGSERQRSFPSCTNRDHRRALGSGIRQAGAADRGWEYAVVADSDPECATACRRISRGASTRLKFAIAYVSREGGPRLRPKKTLLSWSGGKDSAWALTRCGRILRTSGCVADHGERTIQPRGDSWISRGTTGLAGRVRGLPIWKIPCPIPVPMKRMSRVCRQFACARCRKALKRSRSAIYFWRTFDAYRVDILPGQALNRCFLSGEFRRTNWRKPWSLPDCGRASLAWIRVNCPASFCGRVFDAGLSDRFARFGRSMRGARRVSQLRLCGPDVLATDRRRAHSQRRTRRICIRRLVLASAAQAR